MIDALEKGQTPEVDPEEIPCFSRAALAENPVVTKQHLEEILDRLSKADLPTLKRALVSLEHDDQAWLGFKVVTDPAACTSDDPGDEDAPISSDWGPSEDGQSCIFFAERGERHRLLAPLEQARPVPDARHHARAEHAQRPVCRRDLGLDPVVRHPARRHLRGRRRERRARPLRARLRVRHAGRRRRCELPVRGALRDKRARLAFGGLERPAREGRAHRKRLLRLRQPRARRTTWPQSPSA